MKKIESYQTDIDIRVMNLTGSKVYVHNFLSNLLSFHCYDNKPYPIFSKHLAINKYTGKIDKYTFEKPGRR